MSNVHVLPASAPLGDGLFHNIADAQVVLRYASGSYRQAKVYRREKDGHTALYAGIGQSFVLLLGRGGTSSPNIGWEHIHGVEFKSGYLGRPVPA